MPFFSTHIFWRYSRLISDESIHFCKHESKADIKTRHANIQKPYVFADLMYICIENDSYTYTEINVSLRPVGTVFGIARCFNILIGI